MITIQSIRAAVMASDPYTEMHNLVRNEMRAGLKVKEVLDSINPLVAEALDTPRLTEDGEEGASRNSGRTDGQLSPRLPVQGSTGDTFAEPW